MDALTEDSPLDVDPDALEFYALRLFVAGTSGQSARAIVNARRFCERYLPGRHSLEVVDIYQQPALARDEQILAVPTLIRTLPPPSRRLVGDLSDTMRVLQGLGLPILDLLAET
ncbi:MAG: circadian clock KaiB family protein [Chloroflexota bacterium]